MARTPSTAEEKVYAAGCMTVPLQVWIKDGTGTWVELTDLEGHNFVRGVEIGADIDEPVESATIELEPSVYDFKLSPLYEASKINHPSGGLEERIAIGREVAILAAVLPKDSAEPSSASGWRLIFSGDVVALDIAGMSLRCVDKGGRLQRRKLERAGQPEASPGGGGVVHGGDPYVAVGATEAAEDVMQAILDDWADPAVTLVTPSSPGWVLTETWSQSNPPEDANVLDVLRSIASMIGWDVRYRFDATAVDPFGVTAGAGGVGNYTLQFYEPDRSNTTPDIALGPDDYHSLGSIVQDVATVANRVEVFYVDDPGSETANLRSVLAEDATSQTAYGVLYMRVKADDIPGITTETDADTLAAAILNDVLDPRAEMTAEAVYLYHVELFDLIRFSANGEHFDSNQDLAVAGWRHRFTDGGVETSLILSGTIKGHRGNYWRAGLGVDQTVNGYDNDIANGADQTIGPGSTGTQPQPPDLTHDVTLNGFRLKVDDLPLDYSHVEWHISTSGSGFTPDASSLVATTKGTAYVANDLVQGTAHYAKAVLVSKGGIKSVPSAAITALPGTTLAELEVTSGLATSKANSDGMPYALVVDRDTTNYIKNPSFEANVTDDLTKGSTTTLTRMTGAGEFVFGAAGCKFEVGATDAQNFLYFGSSATAGTAAALDDEIWVLSLWAKKGDLDTLVLGITFLDSAGTSGLTSRTQNATLTTDWVRYEHVFTATDASTAKIRASLTVPLGVTNKYCYIDGVQLEKVSSSSVRASTYCDGSLGAGYSWSGTAHNSTSARTGGLRDHGALASVSFPLALMDDGTFESVRLSGQVFRGGGTAFPLEYSTNDTFWRTDRGILYYYDGTRWLSVTEYSTDMSTYGQLWNSITVDDQTFAIASVPDLGGTETYLTKWRIRTQVSGTNTAASHWTVRLKNDAGSTISSFTTATDANNGTDHHQTINSVRTNTTDKYWFAQPDKTGATGLPGTLTVLGCSLQFRLVG